MGLLAEIQNDALSDGVPLATLLRKVLVLASNLDSSPLEDWVRHELNGYPTNVEVPTYRQFPMIFKVSASNGVMEIDGHVVPSVRLGAIIDRTDVATFKCRQAIGTILPDALDPKSNVSVNYANWGALLPGRYLDRSFEVHGFWGETPAFNLLGVLDAVRTRTLDFALSLRKTLPEADEIDGTVIVDTDVERVVNQVFNTTIYNGNVGVLGNANNSEIG